MRYRYWLMFAAVVAVVAAGLVVASQATTTTVRLRVIGPIGRTPPELAPADIKMTIDGQPRTVMSLDPAPATNVLLLIDVSTNLQQLIDVIPRAVVSAMQRPDSAHVAVFDGQLLFAPDPESDSAGFTAFLTKRLRQQRPTPLWDVARTAVLELVKQRKPAAIVLLSDGVDATGGAAAREA